MNVEYKKISISKLGILVIFIQFMMVVFQALVCFICENYLGWNAKVTPSTGATAWMSAFLGGMIYLIPFSVYTAFAVCRNSADHFAGFVILDFIVGFLLKFVLLIALFVIVFKYFSTVHYIVFISFAVQFITQWITFIVLNSRY